jgi:hypothetical protein
MEWSTEDLRAMAPQERARLLRALAELTREDPLSEPANVRRRKIFMILMVACSLWLIPWIFVLAFTLPQRHTADQWSAAWTGFDVLLLGSLIFTGLVVWRRRQVAIAGMLITATLLVCDAWFDVTLSWGSEEFALSVVTALVGELPLAFLCLFVGRRLLRLTVHAVWVRGGYGETEPSLSHLRLFTLSEPERRGPESP